MLDKGLLLKCGVMGLLVHCRVLPSALKDFPRRV